MKTINHKHVFSACDDEGTFIDITSSGKNGGVLMLVYDLSLIPLLLDNVDDVDQIITALNVLRNDMLQAEE